VLNQATEAIHSSATEPMLSQRLPRLTQSSNARSRVPAGSDELATYHTPAESDSTSSTLCSKLAWAENWVKVGAAGTSCRVREWTCPAPSTAR